MRSCFRKCVCLSSAWLVAVLLVCPPLLVLAQEDAGGNQDVDAEVDFARDIKPILETRCLSCHGPDEQEGDLRVDDRDYMLGNYVFEGDAEGSTLFEYIVSEDPDEMMPPPGDGGPLPKEQIELFRKWINEGNAAWPADVTIEKPSEQDAKAAQETVEAEIAKNDRDKSVGTLLWEMCGLLHPLAIHFPVALLIGGALFAVIGFRGESPMSDAAFYCLWLGALGSVLAVASGWSFAVYKGFGDWQSFDWSETIDLHRWGGVGVAVLALVLAIVATISRRRDPYASGLLWKFGLVILAAGAGFVGHQGGKLTHQGLHDRLFDKANIVGDKLFGEEDDAQNEDSQTDDDAQDDAENDDGTNDANDDSTESDTTDDNGDETASGETSDSSGEDDDDDDG